MFSPCTIFEAELMQCVSQNGKFLAPESRQICNMSIFRNASIPWLVAYFLLAVFGLIFVYLQYVCVRSCIVVYQLTAKHDLLRKSNEFPNAWRPFLRPSGRSLPYLYIPLIRAVTTAPLKFIGIVIAMLTASTCAPYVSVRTALRIAGVCGRTVSWLTGVKSVQWRGKPASTRTAPLIVVNHVSWIDFIVLGATTEFGFVMSEAVSKAPVIGAGLQRLGLHVGSILLERGSAASREAAKLRISEKLKFLHLTGSGQRLVVFSEGTLTNGESVVPLKLGAFEAMVPAQPLRIQFSNPHYSLADLSTLESTGLFLCLGGTDMTLTWGDVVEPKPDDTPETLAERTRAALVKGSPMQLADEGSFRDHVTFMKTRYNN